MRRTCDEAREAPGADRSQALDFGYASDVSEQEPPRPDPPTARDQPDLGTAARDQRRTERQSRRREPVQGMVPARERRRSKLERGFMRLVATGGIIGIAVALGAILVGQDVAGWIVGLVIGLTSVILAAILWSSRQL
jgi:hypothetical protein